MIFVAVWSKLSETCKELQERSLLFSNRAVGEGHNSEGFHSRSESQIDTLAAICRAAKSLHKSLPWPPGLNADA